MRKLLNTNSMEIKKTAYHELFQLNELISRSKSFWDYDQDYLKAAIPLIAITESWLQQNEGYTLYDQNEILGFLGIKTFENFWELEHLWIDPKKIRKGYGQTAINHLCTIALAKNIKMISLLPDPPAEKFYLKLGATFTGKKVSSRVLNGPVFHEMVFKL